jgi:UDP-2,4-diacetamido-2,4,6-trideoxy-beta-L-altropyranose hydrolase
VAHRKKVCFRVDASLDMGSGHVMRCLTLADALKRQGSECFFICRDHLGNMANTIISRGHNIHMLSLDGVKSKNEESNEQPKLAHAQWLGCAWQTDAEQAFSYIQQLKPQWLVVDNYALDSRWEQKLRKVCDRILVIDDLADRQHDCDLLLDQTYGQDTKLYRPLVPSSCKLLIGSEYALLRPEFAKLRDYSLNRRTQTDLNKILISMGGVDKDNATGEVLEVLKHCVLPDDCEVTVVMGMDAPWLELVKKKASSLPWKTSVVENVEYMAQLMADSDLAIGAAGSTSWERCALGLPSVIVVLADNQEKVATELGVIDAVRCIDSIAQVAIELPVIIDDINRNVRLLAQLSKRSRVVVDGLGVDKVIKSISDLSNEIVTLRPVSEMDRDSVYLWQSNPVTRKHFVNPSIPSYNEHCQWFESSLINKDRELFIIQYENSSAGLLRLDKKNNDSNEYEISILISPEFYKRGIGKSALHLAFIIWPERDYVANIKEENEASIALFLSAGFQYDGSKYVVKNEC